MPRSQKPSNDDNKTCKDASGKGLEAALQISGLSLNSTDKLAATSSKSGKFMIGSHSDGNIIKNQDTSGLKQKLVNKVKSWSNKNKSGLCLTSEKPDSDFSNIALDLESLSLVANASEDDLYKSDLLRARDSLENLSGARYNKTVNGDAVPSSRSFALPSSSTSSAHDKPLGPSGPHSDSALGRDNGPEATSKALAWDPWNKIGRKNKKDNKKRRTENKSPPPITKDVAKTHSPIIKNVDHKSGDEARPIADSSDLITGNTTNNSSNSTNVDNSLYSSPEASESYEYQPCRHNRKSVDFVNEVLVVYFTGDEETTKSTEPLKKELDQQIRNKEMRRGHIPCTMLGKRQFSGEDYMAAWFKK